MKTISAHSQSAHKWPDIEAALESGGVVILPTETVYGLAARADNADAVSKIYALKGRDFAKPLAVCVKTLAQAESLALFDETSRDLAHRFWPGSLTLVINARTDRVLDSRVMRDSGGVKTIALRCPDADWVKHLTHPLALTSANRAGEADTVSYADAVAAIANPTIIGLEATAALSGAPSTIVRVLERKINTLRQGELDISS